MKKKRSKRESKLSFALRSLEAREEAISSAKIRLHILQQEHDKLTREDFSAAHGDVATIPSIVKIISRVLEMK